MDIEFNNDINNLTSLKAGMEDLKGGQNKQNQLIAKLIRNY